MRKFYLTHCKYLYIDFGIVPISDNGLLNLSLSSVQMQNPILLRQDVHTLYERIFESEEATEEESPTKHDLFRTFIILALGSIHPHRRGDHQCHPFGYYLSAMRNFDRFVVRDGLNPIQDLLLLTRFGIYYHIGTSVWAMVRLCVRMCVEQSLHKRQELPCNESLIQEQMRRRVFWICYMMDRYSSITLNRPFAISDSDIDVGPAADADDQQLSMAEQSVHNLDEFCSQQTALVATEMSAFLAAVRLRQVSSRIHRYFADTLNSQTSARTGQDQLFLATGHIHVALQKFLVELETWRASAPVYESPTCLFERAEWYDLLQAREAFNLLRRALDVAPKRDGAPSCSLLTQCQESAVRVIALYSDMYRRSVATYTRSYFQMMFTAGLSLLYCGSVLSRMESSSVEQCSRALEQCRTTLTNMTVDLPDARHYVAVFDALYRHISQNLNQVLQRSGQSQQETALRPLLNSETPASTANITYSDPMTSETEIGTQNGGFHFSYNEAQYPQDGVDSMFPMSIPSIIGDGQNYFATEGQSVMNSDIWNWDILNDEALWNVGQYVVGDPAADFGIYDPT